MRKAARLQWVTLGLVVGLGAWGCHRDDAERTHPSPDVSAPSASPSAGDQVGTGGTSPSPQVVSAPPRSERIVAAPEVQGAPPPTEEQQPPPGEEPPPGPSSGFPPPPTHFVYPPLQTTVDEYRVSVAPEALQEMLTSRTEDVFPAEFTGPDGRTQPITIRLRGNSSRGWPKKSYRIEFPEGVRFQGRTKLNLVSEWRDQTLMLEKLGYDMLEALGVPASRAKYVRLTLNGQYQGLYLDIERVDKSFLRNHGFVDTDASIWRCGMKNCEMKVVDDPAFNKPWEKQTNELTPSPELDDFMRAIAYTPEPKFVPMLEARFELEHHLRTFVMDALLSNATVEDSRSYVIYDALTKHWSYAPWDLNNTDAKYPVGASDTADSEHPLFNFSLFDGYVEQEYRVRAEDEPGRWKPIFSDLNTRIVLRPELRARVLALTEQALVELFAPAVIHARIDAVHQLLAPYHPGSPYDSPEQFQDGPRYLKEYVANRTAFLQRELARWKAWKPGLVLQTVDPQQGWVELKNLGSRTVDTTGMVLTTELRVAMVEVPPPPGPLEPLPPPPTGPAWLLPAMKVEPGETVRVELEMAPEGQVGLFDGKSVVGVLDALYYGQLPEGQRYVRSAADPLRWEVQ